MNRYVPHCDYDRVQSGSACTTIKQKNQHINQRIKQQKPDLRCTVHAKSSPVSRPPVQPLGPRVWRYSPPTTGTQVPGRVKPSLSKRHLAGWTDEGGGKAAERLCPQISETRAVTGTRINTNWVQGVKLGVGCAGLGGGKCLHFSCSLIPGEARLHTLDDDNRLR